MSSNYTIITEEALEKLVCSNCYKYLSYGKARVGSNSVICGRCNQSKTVLPLFNENIRNTLFPCINRFDKCKELLHYWQVKEHEKTCRSHTQNVCTECTFHGSSCQLYHHYIKDHPNNVLKYPFFRIYLLETKKFNYLFRKNNNLFILTYEIMQDKSVLKMTIKNVGNIDNDPKYQFVIKTLTKEHQCLKTEFKSVAKDGDAFQLDIFRMIEEYKENTITCHLNINVNGELFLFRNPRDSGRIKLKLKEIPSPETDRLKEKENQLNHIMNALKKNLFPKLSCSNCGCFVVPPIYRCSSNHVRCEDCNSSFCSGCNDVVNWCIATDLEVFNETIPLPCRWNCENMFLSAQLREHERTCTKRRYECVEEWCSWNGTLDDLIKHWHSSTPLYTESHKIYGFEENMIEFYLIFHQEMFYWRIEPLRKNGRNVHVRKVSNVSPIHKSYSAKVLLTHTCDNMNKRKECKVTFGGITLIKRFNFDYFGACKNYKIIFDLLELDI